MPRDFQLAGALLLGLVAGGAWTGPATAASYRYITLDPPGVPDSQAETINEAGQVVVTSGDRTRAFIWKSGTFTELSFPPESGHILPADISPWGAIVGTSTPSFDQPSFQGFYYSTLRNKSLSLNIDHFRTDPTAINGRGQVTGTVYFNDKGLASAFVYYYGDYTLINPPGSVSSVGAWINDEGEVVGTAHQGGFTYLAGKYNFLKTGYYPEYVNSNGDISGDTVGFHGFVLSRGIYKIIDGTIPGSYNTALSVNTHGEAIIQSITNVQYNQSFLYRYSGGKVVGINPAPNLADVGSFIGGLTESGSFVGWYDTFLPSRQRGPRHAFIAVCEPAGSRCGD